MLTIALRTSGIASGRSDHFVSHRDAEPLMGNQANNGTGLESTMQFLLFMKIAHPELKLDERFLWTDYFR